MTINFSSLTPEETAEIALQALTQLSYGALIEVLRQAIPQDERRGVAARLEDEDKAPPKFNMFAREWRKGDDADERGSEG